MSHADTFYPAPRHNHDCDHCTYLGHIGDFDGWACEKGDPDRTDMILRYGPDGMYRSLSYKMIKHLVESGKTVPGTEAYVTLYRRLDSIQAMRVA